MSHPLFLLNASTLVEQFHLHLLELLDLQDHPELLDLLELHVSKDLAGI